MIEIDVIDMNENYLKYFMDKIAVDNLYDIAVANDYTGKKNKQNLFEYFLQLKDDEFDDLTSEFRFSARTTNHIFVLEDKSTNLLKFFKDYKKEFNKFCENTQNIESLRRKKYMIKNPIFMEESGEFRFNVHLVNFSKIIPIIEADTLDEQYREVNTIDLVPVRIYFEKRIMCLRVSDHQKALNLKSHLAEINEIFKSYPLYFNKHNKIQAYKGSTLRGASIEFGDDGSKKEKIELSVGVGKKDEHYGNLTESERFIQLVENGKINFITVSAHRDTSMPSNKLKVKDPHITFLLNFVESKIYFYTFMFENEIKDWIHYIIDKCDLDLINLEENKLMEEDFDEYLSE